jgi:uncharacterized protein (DUF2249 family)
MKQVLRNSMFTLVALLSLGFSVMANGNDPESIVEVKFIGNMQSQPVFQMNLLNTTSDEFVITISDLQGNVLYSDRVKGVNISKKFAINTEEVGDNVLRLEVKAKSTGKKESYNINRTQNYVVESVVTRIN